MIVDAHHHFWDPRRGDYHWMTPEVPALARPYGPEDLRPELRRCGVSGTILVQAAQTEAETDYLLEIAAGTDFVLGVVGWLDLDGPDFPARFEAYRANPLFVGLRPMLQDLAEDDWLLRPRVLDHLGLVAESRFPFEFLTYPRHLPHVVEVMTRCPRLHAVVDHLSKPPVASGRLAPWHDLIAACAEFPGLSCKLSGLVTEADHATWSPADLASYAQHVLDCFGENRLLFGSDWPVCRLAGEYAEVINAARTVLAGRLTADGEAKVFGRNALRFYGLASDGRPIQQARPS